MQADDVWSRSLADAHVRSSPRHIRAQPYMYGIRIEREEGHAIK
jgi:hypothetical protein